MGSFYCIPSGCAQIFYREYRSGRLEYQYPNEPKQVIKGNNLTYTTQTTPPPYYGGGCNKIYAVQYQLAVISNGVFIGWTSVFNGAFLVGNDGPVSDVRLFIQGVDYGIYEHYWFRFAGIPPEFPGNRTRPYSVVAKNKFGQDKAFLNITASSGFKLLGFIPSDGSSNEGCNPPGTCTFKVFQAGTQIFSRTDTVCPTVEQFPPTLDEKSKSVIVSKFPYLERVEVVDYGYEQFGLNLFRSDIPDNCLNIYVNGVTAFIPPPVLPVPYVAGNYNFITQICSDDGSPPPEYEVICDCECKSCPPNTCAVFCEDVVCCYDENGTAVETIPINEYCGY